MAELRGALGACSFLEKGTFLARPLLVPLPSTPSRGSSPPRVGAGCTGSPILGGLGDAATPARGGSRARRRRQRRAPRCRPPTSASTSPSTPRPWTVNLTAHLHDRRGRVQQRRARTSRAARELRRLRHGLRRGAGVHGRGAAAPCAPRASRRAPAARGAPTSAPTSRPTGATAARAAWPAPRAGVRQRHVRPELPHDPDQLQRHLPRRADRPRPLRRLRHGLRRGPGVRRGMCVTSCAMGLTDCAGSCRDVQTDRANCGACGMTCASGQVCAGGHVRGELPGRTDRLHGLVPRRAERPRPLRRVRHGLRRRAGLLRRACA
jgi:hypothetical protein